MHLGKFIVSKNSEKPLPKLCVNYRTEGSFTKVTKKVRNNTRLQGMVRDMVYDGTAYTLTSTFSTNLIVHTEPTLTFHITVSGDNGLDESDLKLLKTPGLLGYNSGIAIGKGLSEQIITNVTVALGNTIYVFVEDENGNYDYQKITVT